jgi:purine-binding chemotaxis protein CheW
VSTHVEQTAEAISGGKYFTFALGEDEYGLEILKVREIIGIMDMTIVPRTRDYIRGIINLRGRIIPVIDLRIKFGMTAIEKTSETCIIVVECNRADQGFVMGILVDQVREVLDIDSKEIEAAPDFGAAFDADFILGIAKVKNSVKILLDLDAILGTDEVLDIQAVASASDSQS